jgi:tetratricopeptide (TPR) repeat protein
MTQVLPTEILDDGLAAYRAKDYHKAIELFSAAKAAFLVINNPLSAAEAANNLAMALLMTGQYHEAWEQLIGTDKVFFDAGDRQKQAFAIGNQAAVLEKQGKKKEAVEYYQQSNQILKEIGDKENRYQVLAALSSLQLRSGDYLQAIASRHAALSLKPHLSAREKLLFTLLKIPFKQLNP